MFNNSSGGINEYSFVNVEFIGLSGANSKIYIIICESLHLLRMMKEKRGK